MEAVLPSGKLTIEIRSLNSKNMTFHKSQLLPKKELVIRNKIAESLVRGSIDAFLDFEANSQAGTKSLMKSL